jgi:hypothetical protein
MYDAPTQTLWVEFPDAGPDTLLTAPDTQVYVDALRSGGWEGQPLTAVNFVFSDEECARYNADSLAFLRIGTWLEGPPRRALDGTAPDFEVREDGIS